MAATESLFCGRPIRNRRGLRLILTSGVGFWGKAGWAWQGMGAGRRGAYMAWGEYEGVYRGCIYEVHIRRVYMACMHEGFKCMHEGFKCMHGRCRHGVCADAGTALVVPCGVSGVSAVWGRSGGAVWGK